jgi:hypothetical protein
MSLVMNFHLENAAFMLTGSLQMRNKHLIGAIWLFEKRLASYVNCLP